MDPDGNNTPIILAYESGATWLRQSRRTGILVKIWAAFVMTAAVFIGVWFAVGIATLLVSEITAIGRLMTRATVTLSLFWLSGVVFCSGLTVAGWRLWKNGGALIRVRQVAQAPDLKTASMGLGAISGCGFLGCVVALMALISDKSAVTLVIFIGFLLAEVAAVYTNRAVTQLESLFCAEDNLQRTGETEIPEGDAEGSVDS